MMVGKLLLKPERPTMSMSPMTAQSTQYTVASWVGYLLEIALRLSIRTVTEPLTKAWSGGAKLLNEKPINWVQPSDIKGILPAFIQTTHTLTTVTKSLA